ncbi:MAG TPA: hypothetical protein PL009_11120 [Flavipsychrobacter sp.]|nr:hypothetical protein [Flavipsychrobacter sp.]
MRKLFLTGLLCVSLSDFGYAQKNSGFASQTLNIYLGDVIDIRFVANKLSIGPKLEMSFVTSEDYYNGIESEQQLLQVMSSKNFTVSVRAMNVSFQNVSRTLPSFIYLKVPQNNTGGNVAKAFSDAFTNNYSLTIWHCWRMGKKEITRPSLCNTKQSRALW